MAAQAEDQEPLARQNCQPQPPHLRKLVPLFQEQVPGLLRGWAGKRQVSLPSVTRMMCTSLALRVAR